MLFSTFY